MKHKATRINESDATTLPVGAQFIAPIENDLPEGWVWKKVGEVCEFGKGKKPKNTGHRSDTRKVPYINIKAFETGNPEEYAESGNYPLCSKHDVLIVWDGARSGLVGSGVSGYIGSTLSKVWSHETANKYLFYFLKSQYGTINTNTKGVGIPHVDPGILNAIEIPIAPFPQQKLIVAEIEKQFSRLDEAVSALKRIQANLKRYKASVLKAAVEGKLTEQWREEHPDVEPASELLKRILVERRKKWEEDYVNKYVAAHGHAPKADSWKKKYKEPASPDTSNLPELPKGWVWATVEQLAAPEPNSITDGPFGSNLKTAHYTSEGPRVVRLQNIGDGIFIDERAHISERHFTLLKKHQVLAGDLVVAAMGVSPPRSCIIPLNLGPAIVKADCIRLHPHAAVSNLYLNFALNSKPTRDHTKKLIHGVGRPRLNLGEIKMITVPLPSDAEQHRIIAEVEHHLSIAREVETQVDLNIKRAERLRQSVLKTAFSGRLSSTELI